MKPDISRLFSTLKNHSFWQQAKKWIGYYWRVGFYWLKPRIEKYPRPAIAVSVGLMALMYVIGLYNLTGLGLFGRIPSGESLRQLENNQASEVIASDGSVMGRYYLQDRTDVDLQDLPQPLIDALIATEDARFYQHHGIDYQSMLRVIVKRGILRIKSAGGGSTLHQQLAKNIFSRKHYWFFSSVINKFREMHTAKELERTHTKNEILVKYLNTVPFSGNTFGIQAASLRFFSKSVNKLKVEEGAVLVGMLKGNSIYNPQRDPDGALARRNVVLSQMEKYGYLTEAQRDSLIARPLVTRYRTQQEAKARGAYILEKLRLEVADLVGKLEKPDGSRYNLYTDGLKIYSTLNRQMQQYAEQAFQEEMPKIQKYFEQDWKGKPTAGILGEPLIARCLARTPAYRHLKDQGFTQKQLDSAMRVPKPRMMFSWKGSQKKEISLRDSVIQMSLIMHGGLVAMDSKTGVIRAWVGGIDHTFFQYDQVTAQRQAGSVFKPILYATALNEGATPCTYFSNEPITHEEFGGWTPENADNQYGGEMTLVDALARSVNVVAARLIKYAEPRNVTQMAKAMGITSSLDPVPALALGAADVSLMEMTGAYCALANGGYRVKPRYLLRITDKEGRTLFEYEPEKEPSPQVLKDKFAAQICYMMIGVGNEGTARALHSRYNFKQDIACKTGTSQRQSDGWFIGALPDIVTGVRIGGSEPTIHFRTLSAGQGAATAVPIWANFMKKVLADPEFRTLGKGHFTLPSGDAMDELLCPPQNIPLYEDDFLQWYFQQQNGGSIPPAPQP